jgi:hypothetical protein
MEMMAAANQTFVKFIKILLVRPLVEQPSFRKFDGGAQQMKCHASNIEPKQLTRNRPASNVKDRVS